MKDTPYTQSFPEVYFLLRSACVAEFGPANLPDKVFHADFMLPAHKFASRRKSTSSRPGFS